MRNSNIRNYEELVYEELEEKLEYEEFKCTLQIPAYQSSLFRN